MTTVVIQQGRVLDPSAGMDHVQDVVIIDDRIAHIGNVPSDIKADQTINADQHWVIPGLIDLYTQLHVQQDVQAMAKHAASVGITHVCLSPFADPIVDNANMVKALIQSCQPYVHGLPYVALTRHFANKQLVDVADCQRAGSIGVHNAGKSLQDSQLLRHCFEYAATFNMPVCITANDGDLSQHSVMHEGPVSARLGLAGSPDIAESIDVFRCIELAAYVGARVHFSRVSSARALRLIAEAKAEGLPVTADVSIAHLFLTHMDVSELASVYHVNPPLRDLRDQQALREGLADGTLDAICSDHHCANIDDKRCPFPESLPGMRTHACLLPLTLRLVEQKILTPLQAIGLLTHGPASVLNMPIGSLQVGQPANLCVVDPKAVYQLEETAGYNAYTSAFYNWELVGKVVQGINTAAS